MSLASVKIKENNRWIQFDMKKKCGKQNHRSEIIILCDDALDFFSCCDTAVEIVIICEKGKTGSF